ncbi:hypothetical protein LNKW23_22250 [Paralimibaculum aggregatum]|uniref:C4-dicarboxylate ABC transporter substrate-binding protein n=1 Tax=Paralimibaculum aggregatum TaxID=3036245 RepID=A0ABQ6LIA8_9RHOB|nr:TAXI family TRAP transporter solute-binding subunit [Limibaculum sp. NKW23]GMG83012.1 hypothetical protein LNKW23_22250 [Limibaculum sp. NKW23]
MAKLGLYALAGLILAGLLWTLWTALDLAPDTELSLAAGRAGGGYHRLAERYAEILAEDGITVEILETDGSVDNARLLAEGRADAGLLQGGVPVPEGVPPAAIAALFLEPILFVEREAAPVPRFPPDWRGLALAVGPEGSGARFAWGRLAGTMELDRTANREVALGGRAAAEALRRGEVDLALFVAPTDAPYLTELLSTPGHGLVPVAQVEALTRRLPELVALRLPAGTLDFGARLPPEDVTLLATPARMLARKDLHPALVNRLVRAARMLHSRATQLSLEGDFPSARQLGAPLNPHARALLENGPSRLMEFLPYWVAAQINRFLVLILPALFLLVPLMRAVPALYEWAMRRRIYRFYPQLQEIDLGVTEARDAAALDRLSDRLDALEGRLRGMKLPLSFRENAHLAQSHLGLVRRRLAERREEIAR